VNKDVESQKVAVIICNFLQTINFSCHFVLYVTVNVTFRRTLCKVARIVCLKLRGKSDPRPRKYLRSLQSSTRPGHSMSIETNV
jgi:hypothetical protein